MQIDWLTVIAQIVNFLVLVWLLKRFLYKPIVDAMARREARIASRLDEAVAREEAAEREAREFREKSEALEEARNEKLEEARAAASEEQRRLLGEARAEVDEQRERWLEEVRRERAELGNALRREVAVASIDVARRALSDLADARLEERVVAAFLDRLAESEDARRDLASGSDTGLRLTSSFEFGDEARTRLEEILGPSVDVEYERDESLICGVALSGRGTKLEWNVAAYAGDVESRIGELLATPTGARTDV